MFMLSAFLIFCFLKHTEFCKCLGYHHSVLNRFSHRFFCTGFDQRFFNHFRHNFLRNNQHTVYIAKDNVSIVNRYLPNLNRTSPFEYIKRSFPCMPRFASDSFADSHGLCGSAFIKSRLDKSRFDRSVNIGSLCGRWRSRFIPLQHRHVMLFTFFSSQTSLKYISVSLYFPQSRCRFYCDRITFLAFQHS